MLKRLLIVLTLLVFSLTIPKGISQGFSKGYYLDVFIAMNFDEAFHKLLGHEGGYVNHPDDPGGETNWGITIKVARDNGYFGSMKDLPVETAKLIYKRMYWDAVKADEMPPVVRYALFDAAVNSGVAQAARWLQRAVGVNADGRIGPMTMNAIDAHEPYVVFSKMVAQRLDFMTRLNNWGSFSRGWARRIADILNVEAV